MPLPESRNAPNNSASSLLVIIPAYNEEASVGYVVQSVKEVLPDARIAVIDDGSEMAETDEDNNTILSDGTVEVRDAFTGRQLARLELSRDEAPGSAEWPDWDPFEALVDVDQAGWQVPPLIVRGSGSQVVDAFFRDYIRQQLRPQVEFGPGYYRILIGP